MKYTVVGFHEEDGHIFCEHVDAKDVNDAIVKVAQKEVSALDKCGLEANYMLADINIVEVFADHLEGLNDCTTVSSACDWPGIDKWFDNVRLHD